MSIHLRSGPFNLCLGTLSLALAMVAASCTENAPPKSDLNRSAMVPDGIEFTRSNDQVVTLGSQGAVSPSSPASTVAQATPAKQETVTPPKDAKWTIFCTVVGGPGHSQRAKQFKAELAEATKSGKWYVVHEEDKSTIYYGFYRTIDRGTKEGVMAQADRAELAKLKNRAGELPLQLCSFLQLDRPAPQASAEWDLGSYSRNPRQFWSLQIAAYTADATDKDGHDRKWAAVESVRELRAQGIPAFFHHSDAISIVCVGMWPEEAVKRQSGGNRAGNAGTENPDATIVVSNSQLPANLAPKDGDGHPIEAMVPRIEVLDRSMHDMMQRYPSHLLNSEFIGHKVKDPQTGVVEMVPESTFLVMVPEAKDATAADGQRVPVDNGKIPLLPPSVLQTDQPIPQPGVGRLRSVGQ